MFKKMLLCIILILSIGGAYSADVEVKAYLYHDSTIFNYIFNFNENDSIEKFAVEKPSDAKIDYISDKNGNIEYDEAGDYYIIKLDESKNNTVYLKYTSQQTSQEIFATNSFRNYVNFNFKADTLIYELYFREELGELIDIFPQDYQVYNSEKIKWVNKNIETESLYIINFKNAKKAAEKSPINYLTILYIAIPLIFLIIAITLLFKKNKQLDKLQEKIINQKTQPQPKTTKEIESESQEETPKETFQEIIEKHLTENEQQIVTLVKDNEGISQYDILNHLPHLTKSNLSKIISKLNAKKILKRIKVGKINNIYLGEKLEQTKED